MNKDKLINKILDINLELAQTNCEVNDGLIYDLLRYGFKGLDNMSIEELNEELKQLEE